MTMPSTSQPSPEPASAEQRLRGATPFAAAAFAAGIGSVWLGALWRLLFTYFPGLQRSRSATAAATIAYVLLGITLLVCAAVLVGVHRCR